MSACICKNEVLWIRKSKNSNQGNLHPFIAFNYSAFLRMFVVCNTIMMSTGANEYYISMEQISITLSHKERKQNKTNRKAWTGTQKKKLIS